MKSSADLQKENQELREQLAAEKEKAADFQDQINSLNEHLRHLLQKRFGSSSEKANVDQLGLFNEGEEINDKNPLIGNQIRTLFQVVAQSPRHPVGATAINIFQSLEGG